MSKRKKFNIHDLYPADYHFDWEAFEKDPDGYRFTEADYAYSNAMDLERYESEVQMTPYEKRAVRKWVIDGHSPYENPGSRYLCMTGSEPYDFLDVYRMDREIQKDMKGMNKEQQRAYLMEYMGWTDDIPAPDMDDDSTGFMPADPDEERPFE
ncbi:hypothetical protein SAMN04487770_101233 [Butyrivibrio sp. ob235]|jgi:hypothetical protein|uniref:hypothetical protein n=1 Tax=Butyrivibrio sp. ob235 TaxID=1761780 RepID=UPI0008AC1809|nr:hypothetical protein [Butyrivibrio sp. ob235]SEK34909.1 hypothetical protein SAMN04487770_101233 [Butyrivibrio sp. ob235]